MADELAAALLHVEEIAAAGVDGDQGCGGGGNRRGQFLEAHDLGAAIRMNANRFHGGMRNLAQRAQRYRAGREKQRNRASIRRPCASNRPWEENICKLQWYPL